LSRYWLKDISIKCFNCGEVGHMEFRCTNAEQTRPCNFCATTAHPPGPCLLSTVCFNCEIPGHGIRQCIHRRGMPKRVICTLCCLHGHHIWNCHPSRRIRNQDLTQFGKCLVCIKVGHFSCVENKWEKPCNDNIWCFNCGLQGHHGSQCKRPNVDTCKQSDHLSLQEIERAYKWTESSDVAVRALDDLVKSRHPSKNSEQMRGRNFNNIQSSSARAKSQPASRDKHSRNYSQQSHVQNHHSFTQHAQQNYSQRFRDNRR